MSDIRNALAQKGHEVECLNSGSKPPSRVKIATRLKDDIEALQSLFDLDQPPLRQVRPKSTAVASYMFGDASGAGFGSSLKIDNKIHYLHGKWSREKSAESSNYRELANLINAITDAVQNNLLEDTELFLFTDNGTAESVFFKGTSSSRKLFELMFSLHKLQMHWGIPLHIIHVAGRRMISQGTDGLSRGLTNDGVMAGLSMLNFVPLHLNAIERQGSSLVEWINSWFSGADTPAILTPHEWFTTGHKHSTCVWVPPPAAAEVALEQLVYSIHKRPLHIHLVIIPRLFTARWRKLLGKICCLNFTVPLDSDIWNFSNYEPLVVGLYLPLSRHQPWNLRNTPFLDGVARNLRNLPPSDPGWGRLILCQLLFTSRSLESMHSSLVRTLLQTP
jgi:hypothetical protein